MNILIVEDEPYAAERLVILLTELDAELRIVQKLDSIKSVVSFFNQNNEAIDLIFMDIELADGVCFEIFNQIKLTVPVVFTTAYDKYAIRAFDLNSIHYLLKPVSKDGLSRALEKFRSSNRVVTMNLSEISQLLNKTETLYKRHFLGRHSNRLVHKSVESIAYFFSDDRMLYMVDLDKKKYLIDYTLEELSEIFLDPNDFFRVNRKYIVNINQVDILKKHIHQRLQVFLKIGQEHEMIISRDRVSSFKNWLNK